ncbi:probable dolichyl-diphosphooligosaccharide--protein glycosyltransferase subunit 3B [Abrus precatorius]|uniref:Probable dolichyl-diphosphooligosaccharide--protein glycosyltransferase subunit 3B n=1 Tax=Abrus precatorius TaxID=3816 RepID=A0A8B8MF32_ABRPR|nr:probable dolichyl-diphosphooligosaccharide--protein glycosyltransferase subunit 3B [Abrus precatorius]
MAPLGKIPLLILILAFTSAMSSVESNDERVSELLSLQSRSKSGIIRLNDQSLSRFLTSVQTPRPYSILLFFDAAQLHDKPELRLTDLRNEFSIVASSFIANNLNNPSHSKLFFCDIEFKESQFTFSQFGVNALPHIRFVGPNMGFKDSEPMDQGDFSRLAESMAEFVEAKTKLSVGPIHRPPVFSKNQMILLAVVIAIWIPFFLKKVFAGQTMLHDPKIWLAGSVFVYFFSVSGAMHNIIRKMPMFLVDRNDPSKLVFFYQGSGMQLGAEGFAVGFLYTVVGLLLAFMTHGLVKVRNLSVQRVVMIFALLVSFLAVKQVVYLDNWKTGYGIHGFWPSSWN